MKIAYFLLDRKRQYILLDVGRAWYQEFYRPHDISFVHYVRAS